MNLLEITQRFSNESECIAYLEKQRWPLGVQCVACDSGNISRITSSSEKQTVRRLYECLKCRTQFSVTSGTLFHDSHLPLQKWFIGIQLIAEAKKGMSANQMKRHLGVSYKTAWYMCHRIRQGMKAKSPNALKGTVEIDETYVGGKRYRQGVWKGRQNKVPVMGLIERKGELRLVKTNDAKTSTIHAVVTANVSRDVKQIVTDDYVGYQFGLTAFHRVKHSTINHSTGHFVRGDVHTNTIESAFSLLKRGIVGSYHQLSRKHLDRYLNEFEFRYNNRKDKFIFPKLMAEMAHREAMPYRSLIDGQ